MGDELDVAVGGKVPGVLDQGDGTGHGPHGHDKGVVLHLLAGHAHGVEGGVLGEGHRGLESEEGEESWKNHVQNVMSEPNNESLIFTFFVFGKLFNVRLIE